jgi:hypothetical protein
VTLIKAHRILITSGIVVCLLLAVRLGWGGEPASLLGMGLRIGAPLLAAALQAYYLYRIRERR